MGFLSYSRDIDEHDDGQIVELAKILANEVNLLIEPEFDIFIDSRDIKWGEAWRKRIDDSIQNSNLLFPVITPSFLNSQYCRYEFQSFVNSHGSDGLIFPIHYLDCAWVVDPQSRKILDSLLGNQFLDWRENRFESLKLAHVRNKISISAHQICQLLYGESGNGRSEESAVLESTLSDRSSEAEWAFDGKYTSPIGHKAPAPEIHVYPSNDGRFDGTIQNAIDSCEAGSRIYIHAGFYPESVEIPNKPLEIVGVPTSAMPATIVGGEGSAITIRSDFLRVSNLSFKNSSKIRACCLMVQTRAIVSNCEFTNANGDGIEIANSNPHMSHIKVSECGEFGVMFYSGSEGFLENSEITQNHLANVLISDKSNPTIRGNSVADGQQSGIYCQDYGCGLIEDNVISGNMHAGIATSDFGNPIVRNNRISDNVAYGGIYVFRRGRGTFKGNRLHNNKRADFEVTKKCSSHVDFSENESRSTHSIAYRS